MSSSATANFLRDASLFLIFTQIILITVSVFMAGLVRREKFLSGYDANPLYVGGESFM